MGIYEENIRVREVYGRVGSWGDIVKYNLFCLNWKLRFWVFLVRMLMFKLSNSWV